MSTVTDTVVQTTKALLPEILAAAGIANPALASVATVAPILVQALQLATTFQKAGFMTPEQLASLFATIGNGVQSTHDQWVSMNAAAKHAA